MTTKPPPSEIKRKQNELLASLLPNRLYIALWIRNDPPPENDFHWAFYFHKSASQGGTQHQVNNVGASGYLPDGPTTAILKSNFLCVLFQITPTTANNDGIPESRIHDLDTIMRSYDDEVNSIPGVTCRVWMFAAILPQLVRSGLVRCEVEDLDALQEECKGFGDRFRWNAARNVQPRPVVVSRVCS